MKTIPLETSRNPQTPWLSAPLRMLRELSRRQSLSLNDEELKAIQDYFKKHRREPTRAELETLAQTWSEHCKHKTFTSPIRYREGKRVTRIKNLLGETIVAATQKLKKPWCLSVFKDNAGIIAFDKRWALAYKVETHNHPCAIEPYGGAETGVGGVIRDVLGAGLGAKPVLNTDIFCLCPPDYEETLPEGVLHPRRTLMSVVAGVRDYGNRMGIPTAGGAVWFDPAYRFNPLVFVGTVGLMPIGAINKKIAPGDVIVAVGGRTGRDGLHGATFSSATLDSDSSPAAVQIGHAIMEKRLLDALLKARDKKLYRAVTDCGAGGFSSAIGEMAAQAGTRGGAHVHLDKALLKTTDLQPWEIWLSESQERMVLAVAANNVKALVAEMAEEGVESSVLGEFTDTGRLQVSYAGELLVDLDLRFLHDGLPRRERIALWDPSEQPSGAATPVPSRNGNRSPAVADDAVEILHWMLSHPNVCSREWIIRQYDHEVQGGSVIKPLQGLHHDGPGDACVIWPIAATQDPSKTRGFAVAHGLHPSYGKDPYAMALACADEALSNLACVGADVTRAAFLDNFCWGSPEDPRNLGGLVRAAQGCRDAALGFEVPFISGKDSLYNEFVDAKGRKTQIPGTLLISAIAPVPDIRKAVTMDFKAPGNPIYLLGWTSEEMGGSLYAEWLRKSEGRVPLVELRSAREALKALCAAAQKGLILTAHNLCEGGLAVAAAEMAFSGEIGVHIDVDEIHRTKEVQGEQTLLFSESPSRFLLEIDASKEKTFLRVMKGMPLARIGATIANPVLRFVGLDGRLLMEEGLQELKLSWQRSLPEKLKGKERCRAQGDA